MKIKLYISVLLFLSSSLLSFSQGNFVYFYYPQSSYCSSNNDPTPLITGVQGGTFTSTTGLSITPSTGVIDLDASTPGNYLVSYSIDGISFSNNVTINLPSPADFNYSSTTFCSNDTNPKATITGVQAGLFSSSTGLIINPVTGTINLSASTAGNYDVIYTPPPN